MEQPTYSTIMLLYSYLSSSFTMKYFCRPKIFSLVVPRSWGYLSIFSPERVAGQTKSFTPFTALAVPVEMFSCA